MAPAGSRGSQPLRVPDRKQAVRSPVVPKYRPAGQHPDLLTGAKAACPAARLGVSRPPVPAYVSAFSRQPSTPEAWLWDSSGGPVKGWLEPGGHDRALPSPSSSGGLCGHLTSCPGGRRGCSPVSGEDPRLRSVPRGPLGQKPPWAAPFRGSPRMMMPQAGGGGWSRGTRGPCPLSHALMGWLKLQKHTAVRKGAWVQGGGSQLRRRKDGVSQGCTTLRKKCWPGIWQ